MKEIVATSVNIDKISHNDDQTKVCMKYDEIFIYFSDIIYSLRFKVTFPFIIAFLLHLLLHNLEVYGDCP
jgi:hypothetical protein